MRLNQLVDQLLDVSRLIEGRLELRPEQVDLQALVIEAIDLMRESATQAGSPVLLRLRPEVVGHWDAIRIGQVITNLLSNAIKFGCGRPIEVELDADETSARVQVRDAGEGILPQEQERIFQRFERATSVQRHPGLGPGALDLQADRRRQPRHGSPCRASPVAAPRSASSCRGHVNERPRLLVVDDDVELCESMADALTDAGYDAVTAGDGLGALLAVARTARAPRLIMLDLMMPDMNGWQFREQQLRDQKMKDNPGRGHDRQPRPAPASGASRRVPVQTVHAGGSARTGPPRGRPRRRHPFFVTPLAGSGRRAAAREASVAPPI